MYDYLIVGAGLYGAVFAHEAKKAGKKVLVIDTPPEYCRKCVYRADGGHPGSQVWRAYFPYE